jgi:hypothetical protein
MLRSGWRPAVLLGIVAIAACGKKGPPLAPIVRIPAAVTSIAAQRVGNDVYLTFTIPTANIDASTPVDVSRVDVYGYTGHTPPPRGRFLEAGTLVTSVPVAPPPAPSTGTAAQTTAEAPEAAPLGAAIGSKVTVVDTLTPDELEQGKILTVELPSGARPLPATEPASATANGPLHRYYLALPYSSRERPGPQPAAADMPLIDPPPAPDAIAVSLAQGNVVVRWEAAGGLLGFLFEHKLPDESDPAEDVFAVPPAAAPGSTPAPVPTGPARYNVYRSEIPLAGVTPTAPVERPWLKTPATPLNPAPLADLTFSDPVEFGKERCYVVRAVRGTPPNAIEGLPSAPACITPVDTFPPAPPAGLVAVAAEGSISLIWEPGSEPDLAGYLVLRGAPGDATLQPLTAMAITEARYVDSTVTAGTRYVYAVVAIDNAQPMPNRSMPSERAEETAR